jgi:hypothetical protein
MQPLLDRARQALDIWRLVLALLGIAVAILGLTDRFFVNVPVAMPEGQALFWYAATAAVACWGCR